MPPRPGHALWVWLMFRGDDFPGEKKEICSKCHEKCFSPATGSAGSWSTCVLGGVDLHFLVPSCNFQNERSAKWATWICCAGTSLFMCLKHICFCCQGLSLQETLVAAIASFMTANLEFVRFEVCSSLPPYAITGLIQKYCVHIKYIT